MMDVNDGTEWLMDKFGLSRGDALELYYLITCGDNFSGFYRAINMLQTKCSIIPYKTEFGCEYY